MVYTNQVCQNGPNRESKMLARTDSPDDDWDFDVVDRTSHVSTARNGPGRMSKMIDRICDNQFDANIPDLNVTSFHEEKKEEKENQENKESDLEILEKRKAITVRGLSGIKNLGNTCYANATLQCLNSITYFCSYLRTKKFRDRLEANVLKELLKKNPVAVSKDELKNAYTKSLTNATAILFEGMWSENCEVEPKTFKALISEKCETFKGSGQNDSQELLNFILDCIHEETKAEVQLNYTLPETVYTMLKIRNAYTEFLKREGTTKLDQARATDSYNSYVVTHMDDSIYLDAFTYWYTYIEKNNSIITDLFTGLYQSELICKSCDNSCSKFEPFTILSIETDSKKDDTTLEECLKDFSSEEMLTGENQYNCEKCDKKTDASKSIYIWEPPEVLIIQLKRFKNVLVNNRYKQEKIESIIKFPLKNLTLPNNYSPINIKDYVYDLVAISEHMGTCDYGHYIAHCKNALNDKWYEFNDNHVFHVSDEKIEGEIVGKNAYILFYVRRST